MKKNIIILLLTVLCFSKSNAQFYIGADYALGLSQNEQFVANDTYGSKVLFTPNQSASFSIGRKLKKRNLRIESGVKFTSHKLAVKFDDFELARDEKDHFPKDIFEKFTICEIPLTIKFDFNIAKLKRKQKKESSKWAYSGIVGMTYSSAFNYTNKINGEQSLEKEYKYHLNGIEYNRKYLLVGGSTPSFNTISLNYGTSANYLLHKKGTISFTILHNVGFRPVSGLAFNVLTSKGNTNPWASALSATSNSSYFSTRIGYYYSF